MRPPGLRGGDVFSKQKRSWVMSRIRADTWVELRFRRACWQAGIRGWRLHRRVEGARPDMLFARLRVAVFIDGCFWHGCPKCYQAPRNNAQFWRRKLTANRARDRAQSRKLRRQGWQVLRFWECDTERRTSWCIQQLRESLRSSRMS